MTPAAATAYTVGTKVSIGARKGWLLGEETMSQIQTGIRGTVADVQVVAPGRKARKGARTVAYLDVTVEIEGQQRTVRCWDKPTVRP